MKYIAYGSNMSLAQMKYRCPNARFIGKGYLPKYRLEFYLHATIEPAPRMRKGVPVAVFEIDETDEKRLDRYEGYPSYYRKDTVTVNMKDGTKIEGMVYIMEKKRVAPPEKWYFNDIVDAYVDLGLGSEIKRHLNAALVRCKRRTT